MNFDRTVDRRWWALSDKDEMARSLDQAARVGLGDSHAQQRRTDFGSLARLFEEHNNQVAFGVANEEAGLLPRNVMRTILEAAHNMLTDSHPRPFYGSSGGDADLRFRLEDLNTAISGLFLMHEVDAFADLAQLHAILWGTGIVKIDAVTHTKRPRVVVERVYPWEAFVDPLDAVYGQPTTFYQVRWIDRRRLISLWPRKRREIEEAQGSRPEWATWLETMAEPVRVLEAWHIDQDGDEGRHVIAIDKCVLLDEPYVYDAPPLVFFHYGDPLTGYWPTGLGHALRGQQEEVNAQMDLIQEIVARMGSPAILVEKNSEVEEGHIDNVVGRIIKYQGVAPQPMAARDLTAEPRQHLQDTTGAMYERAGIPQTSATGTKPAGLQSGRALRIHADLASGRLRVPSEKRQRAYLALGHALIRAQRKLATVDPEAVVVFTDPKSRSVRQIRWADVDVDDTGLKLMAQPISALPSTPGAKAAVLDEYLGAGIITPEEYREAIGLADLLALDSTATAPRKLIERQILGMLRDGERAVPESYFPLALAQQLGQQHYCQALLDEVAEDRLALLRAYIDVAIDLQKPPPAPAPDMAAMPPGAPADAPVDPTLTAEPPMPPEAAGAPVALA